MNQRKMIKSSITRNNKRTPITGKRKQLTDNKTLTKDKTLVTFRVYTGPVACSARPTLTDFFCVWEKYLGP